MIAFKVKVLHIDSVGCIWMTTLEVADETGVEPVLPQHFTIYTESKPDLVGGQLTTFRLLEKSDLGATK